MYSSTGLIAGIANSSYNMTGSASKPVAGENDLAQNPFNLGAERGRSLFDSRQRLVLSYQWAIPVYKQPHGWYQQILSRWQPGSAYAALYSPLDLTMGWWRHNKGCLTLWVGGQVSKIPYTPKGIDYRWYTGEKPDSMPRF